MVRLSSYQEMIRERMAAIGRIGAAEPRHVEAWMRTEHSNLDELSADHFDAEIRAALGCIAASSATDNDALAASMGL